MSDKNQLGDQNQQQIHTPRSKSTGNALLPMENHMRSPASSTTQEAIIREVNDNLELMETSLTKSKLQTGNRTIIARSQSVPIKMLSDGFKLLYPTQPKPAKISPKSKLLLELWRRKMQTTVIHMEESMTISALG